MAQQNELPVTYQTHFKNAAKQYDNKEYKKAMASVDKILEMFPEHADSLALKGLLTKAMKDNNEEAYKFIKQALKNSDNKSLMAWNVYGTLKKDENDYATAQKCFANALKLDPLNLSVACDLAYVQAQNRDFKALVTTRNLLLQQKPQYWFYWTGAIVANHLAKNYAVAVTLIDTFLKQYDLGSVNGSNHKMSKYELSELLLYKAKILLEVPDYQQCLKFLNIVDTFIKDRVSLLEYKATCLAQLNRNADAKKIYHDLLNINSENHDYLKQYQLTSGLPQDSTSEEHTTQIVELYDSLAKEYPDSAAIKRIPLNYLSGEGFRKRVSEYVKPFLTQNVPSLFSNLKALYTDSEKVQIIEEVFLSYANTLEKSNKYPDAEETEAPTTYLWTLLYLAFHYDKLGQLQTALETINKAIKHTPTAIELYMAKARILKHSGAYQEAANAMDIARKMDLADRYLNTKATKYLLRADRTEEAADILYLFAKDQEQKFNIADMQGSNFEISSGDSFLRQNKIGRALKSYGYVISHFEEIRNDQYDFHAYCLRKYMMRNYVEYLRYNDHLESHNYYFRAATGVLTALLALHAKPSLQNRNSTAEDQALFDQLVEKRRLKKDEDPFGEKLMNIHDLLAEADKYLKVLSEHCADRIETHVFAATVYIKSNRYLHAMKALKEGVKVDAGNADLHKCIVQLFHKLESGSIDESASRLIKLQQSQVLGDAENVHKFNEQYYAKYGQQKLSNTLSYAECSYEVLERKEEKSKLVSLITDLAQFPSASLTELQSVTRSLERVFGVDTTDFKEKAKQRFPLAVL